MQNKMDYRKEMARLAALVECALDSYLPLKENHQKVIYEAMRYSALGGGKRVRGVLALVSCLLAGGREEDALPFAAAVEMIHAYSLIHDDLPAMDDDDLRRGKPTNHKVYGEAMAILAGDALLSYAFETVLDKTPSAQRPRAWEALRQLAGLAGTEGMVGGQVVDMEAERKQIGYDELVYLQRHKTGALIRAACVTGAVMGGAPQALIERLCGYADKIGLAFQIQDDILDQEGDGALLGKPTGSDRQQEKSTFLTVCGARKAKEMVRDLSDQAAREVEGLGEYGQFLAWFAGYLENRNM